MTWAIPTKIDRPGREVGGFSWGDWSICRFKPGGFAWEVGFFLGILGDIMLSKFFLFADSMFLVKGLLGRFCKAFVIVFLVGSFRVDVALVV